MIASSRGPKVLLAKRIRHGFHRGSIGPALFVASTEVNQVPAMQLGRCQRCFRSEGAIHQGDVRDTAPRSTTWTGPLVAVRSAASLAKAAVVVFMLAKHPVPVHVWVAVGPIRRVAKRLH